MLLPPLIPAAAIRSLGANKQSDGTWKGWLPVLVFRSPGRKCQNQNDCRYCTVGHQYVICNCHNQDNGNHFLSANLCNTYLTTLALESEMKIWYYQWQKRNNGGETHEYRPVKELYPGCRKPELCESCWNFKDYPVGRFPADPLIGRWTGDKASAPHYQDRYPYPRRDQLSGRRETCYGKTENCRAETAAPPKHKHADPNHRMPERGQSGPALQDTEILQRANAGALSIPESNPSQIHPESFLPGWVGSAVWFPEWYSRKERYSL